MLSSGAAANSEFVTAIRRLENPELLLCISRIECCGVKELQNYFIQS